MDYHLIYLAIRELESKETIKIKKEILSEIKSKKGRKEFEDGFDKGFIKSFVNARSKLLSNDK